MKNIRKKISKNRKTFNFLFALLTFAFCLLTYTTKIYAQTVSLAVSPPILQVLVKPGKLITQVYKITNYGDPTIITSKIYPSEAKDNQGHVRILSTGKGTDNSTLSWFSYLNANLALGEPFFLSGNETQEVVLKIAVPPDTQEGDYYFTIVFSSESPPKSANSGTRATGAIGSNILLTISNTGNPVIKGEIKEFSAPKIIDSFDILPVKLVVKNTGTTYFAPKGKITFSGLMLGSEYTILPQNILGNSERILVATPSATLDQDTSYPITLGIKGFFLGTYKLKTEIDLGDGKTFLVKQINVYGFPFKITLVILAGAIVIYGVNKVKNQKLKGKISG